MRKEGPQEEGAEERPKKGRRKQPFVGRPQAARHGQRTGTKGSGFDRHLSRIFFFFLSFLLRTLAADINFYFYFLPSPLFALWYLRTVQSALEEQIIGSVGDAGESWKADRHETCTVNQ